MTNTTQLLMDAANERQRKWHWMMDYCKKNHMSPGEQRNWELAEKEYRAAAQTQEKG